ncbi:MAG: hypothetical protein M9887_04675 [Chitinophagales bacterium]|nr:hypothetical protein [Chitinophagales bacterium]
MKKLLFLNVFLLLLSINVSFAQNEVKVYDTYEDYIAEKPSVVYKELTGFSPNKTIGTKAEGLFGPILRTRNAEGKKEASFIQNKWGFVYRDILFRNSKVEIQIQGRTISKPEYLYFALKGKIGDSILVWVNAIDLFENEFKELSVRRSAEIIYGDFFHYSTSINGDFHLGQELTTDFKSYQNQINATFQCFYDNSKILFKTIVKNKKTGIVDYERFYLKAISQASYKSNSVFLDCIDK